MGVSEPGSYGILKIGGKMMKEIDELFYKKEKHREVFS
jgi:hypothetical protein